METSLEGGGAKALQPTPENLETQLTSFIVNLKELHACGNSSYFELPIEFLEFIEEKPSVVNPALYIDHRLQKCEETAQKFDERLQYINQLETSLKEALNGGIGSTTTSDKVEEGDKQEDTTVDNEAKIDS